MGLRLLLAPCCCLYGDDVAAAAAVDPSNTKFIINYFTKFGYLILISVEIQFQFIYYEIYLNLEHSPVEAVTPDVIVYAGAKKRKRIHFDKWQNMKEHSRNMYYGARARARAFCVLPFLRLELKLHMFSFARRDWCEPNSYYYCYSCCCCYLSLVRCLMSTNKLVVLTTMTMSARSYYRMSLYSSNR